MLSRTTWTRSLGSLLGAVFLLSGVALAGPGWMSRGLQDHSVSSLVVEPGSPSRIYAAVGVEGVFQSADGGETWTQSYIGGGLSVEKLAFDERNGGALYAVAGPLRSYLFRSTDRGKTWKQVNSAGLVTSVAVNPKEADVLHVGHAGATVSTSRDGGTTWSDSSFSYYCSFICDEAITSLELDPAVPSTMYAGIDADFDYPGFASMFKSTDGGKSWKQSDAGVVLWSSVYSIAVDPSDSQRVLAGASGYDSSSPGIYLSEDGGQTWRNTSNSASRALVFDPSYPQALYAGTDKDGVLRSVDSGRNWSSMNSGLSSPRVLSLTIDRARGLLFAGTRTGVFSYPIAEQRDAVIDVFDSGGDTTGFLLLEAHGHFRLGTANGSGAKALGSPYGP
ncbi:MAG TPA: hypothetical protein VKG01_06620, partial [Thermoanaerobaculia bacterium]|nr:hypothetical protein [Thermoanaerobaculia bacterium]